MQHNAPAAPAVRDLLERVLRSETFARSDRARKLLNYLVEREQAGDAERLKGFAIAMDVFGKDSDFDPSTDAVVRVQAGRLRELLTQYYAGEGADDKLRITIPRGGYVPSYHALSNSDCDKAARPTDDLEKAEGQVPAEVLTAEPKQGGAIVIRQVRLFWAAMAAVIAMLAFIVYRMALPAAEAPADVLASGETAVATAAIATVPTETIPTVFVDAAPDSPQALRVAQQFRMALAGFDTVRLIGRVPDRTAPGIGYSFAFHFLDGPTPGSVNIEFGNVQTGRVLLTRTLEPADLDAAHIGDRVADLLSSVIPVSGILYGFLDEIGSGSELVKCLLLNDGYYLEPGKDAHRAAYSCLETLANADAKSPIVYAELAALHMEAVTDRYEYPAGASTEKAMSLALRAVKMGPTSPAAHRALGYINSRTGERAESIRWMKKAYELNIYDLSMASSYAYSLIFTGDYAAGQPIIQRAVEAASAHPSWWDYGLFLAAFMNGDLERAAQATDPLAMTKRSHYLAARLIAAAVEGDVKAATALSAEIAERYPKFAANPRATFQAANYPPDLTDRLVEALRAAGLGGAS